MFQRQTALTTAHVDN